MRQVPGTAGRAPQGRVRRTLIGGAVSTLLGATLVVGLGSLPASAAAATKLAFTTGPVSTPAATGQTIKVSAEDGTGAVDATNGSSVTLAIGTNPAAGVLTCTSLTVTAVSGVATFANCAITNPGTGYTLTATATGPSLSSAVSSAFNITGVANKLAFTSGPVNAPVGVGQTITVSVEDVNGNVVSNDSTTNVTLAIQTNPASGVLTCTLLTVMAVSGVATFNNCAISTAGTGYVLKATSSPLTAAVSGAFVVTGVANKLAFTTGPVSVPTAATTQTIKVSVEDAAGNVIGTDAGRVVTIAIQTNPAAGVLSCTSTLAVADVAGVSTFTGCAISVMGIGYTLQATAAPLTAALSAPFNVGVTAAPTQIAGNDAIATAIAVSTAEFPINGSAHAVVVARSDFFSDALTGGPLAAAVGGPLLITPGTPLAQILDARVLAEIQRVLPAGGTVYLLGGALALSPNIDNQLTFLGYNVIREAGVNLFDTAIKVAQQLGNRTIVFLATGLNFYDALSAVPAAIRQNAEILLTNGNVADPETASYLSLFPGDTVYAIGGPLAAYGADPAATPIYGQDLFGTSAAVANAFFPNATVYGAATSSDFPDALGGGVFMATGGRVGPLLLVAPTLPLSAPILAYLATLAVGTPGFIFGGFLAVPAAVVSAIQAAV